MKEHVTRMTVGKISLLTKLHHALIRMVAGNTPVVLNLSLEIVPPPEKDVAVYLKDIHRALFHAVDFKAGDKCFYITNRPKNQK